VTNIWWFVLGVVMGLVAMLPLMRVVLRRVEKRARARDAERRARDAERLAELGHMTSGLAHEIKNPLSTVGLNAQLLAEGIRESALPEEESQRLLRRLESLRREVERLGGILNDFLQFAGRMKLDPQPVDLRRLVEELSDFYHPQCTAAGVMLRTQLPQQEVIVKADEKLLKQAVLNLMINATQVMGDSSGATGDTRTRNNPAKAGKPVATPTAAAGNGAARELMLRVDAVDSQANLHVIDTGPGIEAARISEIFLPYVSGRKGGTGLGLPTARRIVEEHGGTLEAHSELGRGSDFVIRLPLSAAPTT
jgi:signal transduction histidine kinase